MRKAIPDVCLLSSIMDAFWSSSFSSHGVSEKCDDAIHPTSQPYPFYTTDGNANKENW
jgi:hypothetical protein